MHTSPHVHLKRSNDGSSFICKVHRVKRSGMVPNKYLLTIVSSQEVSSSFSVPSKRCQAFPAVECSWQKIKRWCSSFICEVHRVKRSGMVPKTVLRGTFSFGNLPCGNQYLLATKSSSWVIFPYLRL